MASAQSWPAHPKPRTRHRTSQLRPPRHPPEPARSEHWSVGVGTGDCRSGCAYDRAKPHSLRSYGFALSSAPPSTDKLPARALRHQPMLRLLRLYGCCYVLHSEQRWQCPRLLSRLRCTRIRRLKPGVDCPRCKHPHKCGRILHRSQRIYRNSSCSPLPLRHGHTAVTPSLRARA